jgi:hypothetical protein
LYVIKVLLNVYLKKMPKLISLKIDEKLLQDTEIMVSKLGISRNKYINDAVLAYTKAQKRAEIEAQIKKEVALIRESSMEVLAEFEALEDDYEY